jgi:hypothetical protein
LSSFDAIFESKPCVTSRLNPPWFAPFLGTGEVIVTVTFAPVPERESFVVTVVSPLGEAEWQVHPVLATPEIPLE